MVLRAEIRLLIEQPSLRFGALYAPPTSQRADDRTCRTPHCAADPYASPGLLYPGERLGYVFQQISRWLKHVFDLHVLTAHSPKHEIAHRQTNDAEYDNEKDNPTNHIFDLLQSIYHLA
jgi:hypothetical protein